MLDHEKLTEQIIGGSIEVHRELGPGLLESVYEECLGHELKLRGLSATKQVAVPVVYKGCRLDCDYRADLIVESSVLLEIKSVAVLLPVHEAQLLTYLRLTGLRVGLLINFNVPVLKDGIRRRVL